MSQKYRIKIPRRLTVCFNCGEKLKPGMYYYSALYDSLDEVRREDSCASCWEKEDEKKESTKYTYWCAKVTKRREDKELKQTRDEKLLKLLQSLLFNERKEDTSLVLILCLYLERKKYILRRKEEKEVVFYENPFTEEVFVVKKVEMSSILVEIIQEKINKTLENN